MCLASDKRSLECPVFEPTLDEVRSLTFEQYVEKCEPEWLHVGICRIKAPEGWTPRRSGYDNLDHLELPRPIRQHATGRQGLYRTLLVENRSMSLPSFKAMTEIPTNAPPNIEIEELERKFWRNVPMNPPLYGADVPGSLFDERNRGWTLKHLSSLLSRTLEEAGAAIPGVTQPYLYAGSWRSFFAWHTEDLDLHSVNYLHCGAPKTWYVIPPAGRERFELVARDLLPELSRYCPEFLRHKEILLSPALLAAHNIPVVKTVHNEREFVVVGPGAYHAGFNHGFNLAESVNFATKSWVPVGAKASFCMCRPDSVKIDMRLFVDYMDPKLAKEVLQSYDDSSDEDDDDDDDEEHDSHCCRLGEEEEAEEESDGVEGDSSSSESSDSSSSESESESEEEEELPAKRTRRPTAKAAASGMHVYHNNTSNGAAAAGVNGNHNDASAKKPLRRLNGTTGAASGAVLNKATKQRPLALPKKQHQTKGVAQRRTSSLKPPARGSGSGSSRQQQQSQSRGKLGGRTTRNSTAAAPVAVAGALVQGSSSDDDSNGSNGSGAGAGAVRPSSKRGAARAWYALFDSLLPSLKRARS